jgi:AcrR family transcriptional regulator/DNA-binding MarR family transcriptional regulator
MLAAMAEVASGRGAANVTVADVVARSGVSRRTFYEQFADREECFLAAFDEAIERACDSVLPAYDAGGRWRERIRSALTALLQFLDEEPFRGRLLVVETLGAGPAALRRRQQALARIIAAVDEGRSEAKAGEEEAKTRAGPPPLTAEGVAGAVLAVVHTRMLERDTGSLLGLANQLMAMIVLPYAGAAAARHELARPRPSKIGRLKPVRHDPLTELEMRLTYRTIRVLMAVGAHPGSSNRQVADTAGISDPGQISKLLGRLHHLGLIEKAGAGRARGEPNAWTLTQKGREVERAMAAQTSRS